MLLERSARGDYAFDFWSHDDSLGKEGVLLRNWEDAVQLEPEKLRSEGEEIELASSAPRALDATFIDLLQR